MGQYERGNQLKEYFDVCSRKYSMDIIIDTISTFALNHNNLNYMVLP